MCGSSPAIVVGGGCCRRNGRFVVSASGPNRDVVESRRRRLVDRLLLFVLIAATVAVLIDRDEPNDPESFLLVAFVAALTAYVLVCGRRAFTSIRGGRT